MNKKQLKEIIDLSGLSREEFAKKLGISISTLNSWQYRNAKIPDSKVNLIEAVFKNVKNTYSTQNNMYKPEGKIIDTSQLPKKDVIIIPIKGRAGLENAFYDDLALGQLEIEKLSVKYKSSRGSRWFKIEVEGASMDDSTETFDGTKYSLVEGDWAYCRSIPRTEWRSKFHFHRWPIFCFFHNTRGIIFKKIKHQNVETGELILESINQDKNQFPDFKINIAECTFICNVIKVLSEY